jgi:aerobic carbon-monoxide dehydrogenase medium subunit
MKPAPFDYQSPESISEALELLSEHGYDAKILAGGQSLMPVMNMRLLQPRVLIDINRIPDLDGVEASDGTLTLGALVRQQRLVDDGGIETAAPLLAESAHHIAHRTIRNRGTVGGSLAHADPASELPAVAVALDAEMTIRSLKGERRLPARDFFLDYLTTALEPDELLTSMAVPATRADATGTAFFEVSRRHGDFAVVAVAVVVSLGENHAVSRARLVITGVGPAPHLVSATDALLGQELSDEAIAMTARDAAREIDPQSDVQASAQYRRHVARVLSERALRTAAERAQDRPSDG